METNESLVEKIRRGDSPAENMSKLYENLLPLIKKVCKPYSYCEDMDDLTQTAFFGVYRAAQEYECDRNAKFSTFATWWIRAEVSKYVEKCQLLHIPAHTRQEMTRYRRMVERLRQEYQREPTASEIAAVMKIPEKKIAELQNLTLQGVSLDSPLQSAEDASLTLADTLEADINVEANTVDAVYYERMHKELWGLVADSTDKREYEVLVEIFVHHRSMSDVAREHDLSPDRIRQIKLKGISKLQRGKAIRRLRELAEIEESKAYRGGYGNFRQHGDTSVVEHIAIRRVELMESELAQK